MESVYSWLLALFDSPEAILCLVYFFIRLIYWICTRKKAHSESVNLTVAESEIKDIYIATAQLYQMLKEEKEKESEKNSI